ncbi:hypothetical protein [Actinomadura atramentaria]|uniref:hypothetical protein n=1 Tax=Actinomadura atramentaria TaxID=1990 RepID=UPI00039BA4CC|nr:hypothetical protein [Actinomadura atramentaria]
MTTTVVADGQMSRFAADIYRVRYAQDGETWPDTVRRVVDTVMRPLLPDLADQAAEFMGARKFIPGGRYLYAAGRKVNQVNNCFLVRAADSREGWADLTRKAVLTLGTGGGLGVVYSDIRPAGARVKGTGGLATGPISLMKMINDTGRYIRGGGSRRSALWAGLHWDHDDIEEFITAKQWNSLEKQAASQGMGAPLDQTNISVILDNAFFAAYHNADDDSHEKAHRIYETAVEQMLLTGEPGLSIDCGEHEGENLRNPCCEVTSHDSDDVCNLGSINLPRIKDLDELERVVEVATAFLLCGTIYSALPYPEVEDVRERNRRIGLGLMGIHEWLIRRGKRYAPDVELARWLDVYAGVSDSAAIKYADRLKVSRPVAKRAIAPTGTIAILGETSSGIEPLYSLAYKRRYFADGQPRYQYVVDEAARRLIAAGINPEDIETAVDLAAVPERRIGMQAWLQTWIDMGISSTLNLPAFGGQAMGPAEFGDMLAKYLPLLRGLTVFPDGARGRQPLTAVPYSEAVGREGVEYFEESAERSCSTGVCGI